MDGFLDRFNFSQAKDAFFRDRADPQPQRKNRNDSSEDDTEENSYIPYHNNINENCNSNEFVDPNAPSPTDVNNVGTLRAGETLDVGGACVVIEKFLAEGGNAHVYIAAIVPSFQEAPQSNPDLPPNRCVLKRIAVPDKKSLILVEKEIETMRKLQGSPNIVDFYASSTRSLPKDQGGYETFILMEYCSEGTLVDFMKIREASMLSEPEVLYFFHEICMGVASMHSQTPKIVHRDLKVENVLITNTQKLKICDFGSSTTELIAPGSAINVARAQVLEDELAACTTMQYRAPEMLDLFQRRGLTEKLDIWALGVLLYKLCYFKTPFDDEGPLAILNCRYSFPPNPMYSPSLLHLIRSILQENPDQRPSVEKIIINVCQIRGVQPTVTEPSPVIPPKTPEPLKDTIRPATILAPTTSQPGPLFNADVITPMRRGRPTRQKPASTPDNTLTPLPANAFVSPSADPFEMIAAGLNLPATSGGGSPWDVSNPEPDSRGSFWNNPPMASSQKNNLKAEPIHLDNPVPPIPPPKPRSLMSSTPQYLAGVAPPKPPRHRNHSPANRNH